MAVQPARADVALGWVLWRFKDKHVMLTPFKGPELLGAGERAQRPMDCLSDCVPHQPAPSQAPLSEQSYRPPARSGQNYTWVSHCSGQPVMRLPQRCGRERVLEMLALGNPLRSLGPTTSRYQWENLGTKGLNALLEITIIN